MLTNAIEDLRTLWYALGQRAFFRTVSQVEVTASHKNGHHSNNNQMALLTK